MAVETFQLTFSDRIDPENRTKIERELARIEAGKLPRSFPRNTWNRGYRHWRIELDKDKDLVRKYTEEMGRPPNNRSETYEQFTYSSRKRNHHDVLASVQVSA